DVKGDGTAGLLHVFTSLLVRDHVSGLHSLCATATLRHMADMFADELLEKIASKGSPICVGLDPIYESIPEAITGPAAKRNANDADQCIDAMFEFTIKV